MVFDHWSIHKNIRFLRTAFRAIILLACFRGLSQSRMCPILWHALLLHFSIGGYDYRRTTRFRQNIHFSIIQVFFADHMRRRARVDNKFSFLKLKSWCKQAPIFRRWEECCFFLALLILEHFWPASTLLRGHLALATLSPPETGPQNLERWSYSDEVHLGKSVRAKDFGIEF